MTSKNLDALTNMAESAITDRPYDTTLTMAAPISAYSGGIITSTQLGLLSNGSLLWQPMHDGKQIVIDLTPGEDDWLDIIGANADLSPLHEGETAQSLKLAKKLPLQDADMLADIEMRIKQAMNYSAIHCKVFWKGLLGGYGNVVVHLVLEDSHKSTAIKFIQGETLQKGSGKKFLDNCIGSEPYTALKDFRCKAKVLLECMQETPEYITLTCTVLSCIFAPVPSRCIVDHTSEEEAAAIRAAKRFRYRF
jgi:hypothetical protein